MKTRSPAQAGAFYPKTEQALRNKIRECFLHRLGPGKTPNNSKDESHTIAGLIVPHAGYDYSGPVAAHSYYRLANNGRKKSVVILGPNHTGRGSGVSIMIDGEWATPMGNVSIDIELANAIMDKSGLIDVDEEAHKYEHSIEVQLPFMQFIYGDQFSFVPICMMLQDLETSIEIGKAIAETVKEKNTLVIASSDWTHYEPQASAIVKDKEAIRAALSMDEKKFQHVIEQKNVSACGYGPVTAVIQAAKVLKAKHSSLLSYHTSGDITGDTSAVVGYAAASFEK